MQLYKLQYKNEKTRRCDRGHTYVRVFDRPNGLLADANYFESDELDSDGAVLARHFCELA